jgi:hypothetical protein
MYSIYEYTDVHCMSCPDDDPFGSKHVCKTVNILRNKQCAFVGYIDLLLKKCTEKRIYKNLNFNSILKWKLGKLGLLCT